VGRELEVYIDDIVIMAQSEEQHLLHLRKAFERMRQYKFQIHPLKCAFGVSAGKELGFHSFLQKNLLNILQLSKLMLSMERLPSLLLPCP